MSEPIRVLIVDDHPIVRHGLRTLLGAFDEVQILGEAVNGAEAVQAAGELHPDVVLMDLAMPTMGGVEATSLIHRQYPQVRILALTSFAGNDQIFPAIKAGALGYMLKDCEPAELVQAIQEVHAGRPALNPAIAARILQQISPIEAGAKDTEALTEREVDVLRCIARGQSNVEIGQTLSISEHTVSVHVCKILEKLHLANRTQAALYALRSGLVGLYPD